MFKPFVSGAKLMSSNPTITASTTKGSFKVSIPAMRKLGIIDSAEDDIPENRIVLFTNPEASNGNELFGVSKGYRLANGDVQGAKVAVANGNGTFAFAPAWPVFIMSDYAKPEVDLDDLERAGLIAKTVSANGTYVTAKSKVQYNISDEAVVMDIDGVNVEVFFLVDPLRKDAVKKNHQC